MQGIVFKINQTNTVSVFGKVPAFGFALDKWAYLQDNEYVPSGAARG